MSDLVPSYKVGGFMLLAVAVGVGALFGFTEWAPTPEQETLINAVLVLVSSLLGIGVEKAVAKNR